MVQINEGIRKFPIKFYEKPDGSIYYENQFLSGNAKDLNDAFNQFKNKDWEEEFLFYYEDILNVEFGAFVPAYNNRKYKGMKYLGKIELKLDIDPMFANSQHSVTHLEKNPQDYQKHVKYIKDLRNKEKIAKFKSKLARGLKKVAGYFNEMFFPEKTRKDLICEHCGEIIPVTCYYERYEGQDYHLECIWDKLFNENKSNSYSECREFFFGLEKYVGHWPNNLDIEEDYLIDLDFVKGNDRKNASNN